MVFVIAHFCRKKSTVHFARGIFRPRAETVRPVISIGMAPSLLNICACAVAVVINHQLLLNGGDLAVGANGILSRTLMLVAMLVVGLTQGAQPIIGYNHGACRFDRVKKAFKLTFWAGTVITSLGFLACEIFPYAIARAFTDNETMIEFTIAGMRIGVAAFPLVGGQIVINNFFQAIGHGKTSAALSTTRQMLFLVPGVLVFPHFFGQTGVWMSLPVADLAAVLVTAWVFLRFLRNYKPNIVVSPSGNQSAGAREIAEFAD